MTDTRSVTIRIPDAKLEELKNDGYSLCFAKKVNGKFNVVWQSADDYISDNTFSWQPQYQLFGGNTMDGPLRVHVRSKQLPIGLGEEATLDHAGVWGGVSTGGPGTGITMHNEFGSIHPGLSAYVTGIGGKTTVTPIYLAEKPILSGELVLTPEEVVQVWFQQYVTTSTIVSNDKTEIVEIDLTSSSSATRSYDGTKWSTPKTPSLAVGVDFATILTIVATLTAAVSIADFASKLSAKVAQVYSGLKVDVTSPDGWSVTIKYSQAPGLTGAALAQTRALSQNPAMNDQLTAYAAEAFAQVGVGYTSLMAIPA
ncbi:hypothetical protein SAMN04488074_111180 [Lentzea albidocapillata subsp. violacea]|uniref:Uncharacterized protein n=1 Tax=Lentzea albidocapillata subsp. violacea TaxID=128104 RepID=A0A1G9KLE8_9PSEU|nr:hypothetical protein [Lentzea albidocapillata]SDL50489.1 hypothetical protein SAMN04488074_111180 [Lentzea albidocapillata subsp. violacea]